MSQHIDPTPKQTDLTSLNSNFKTEIAQNTDLNTLKTPGLYYSPSASVTDSLLHSPITSFNFVMLVLDKGGGNTTQVIFARGSVMCVRTSVGGSFESWYQFTGTVMT